MKMMILALPVILASNPALPNYATAQIAPPDDVAVGRTSVQESVSTANSSCPPDRGIRVDGGGCYSTPQAALTALPSIGGTMFIPPGTYACPSDIVGKSNIQLIGQSYDPPARTAHGINSSWLDHADKKVIFECNSTWTIDSSNGLVLQGIQIQTV